MGGVNVIGIGQTKYGRRRDVNTAELLSEAVVAALADAELIAADLDAVFFGSAPDGLRGVSADDQWLAGPAGSAGRRGLRISTGGSTGMSAALAARDAIAARQCDVAIAVAVERANEAHSVQALMNTNMDPIFEKGFGLNAITAWALFATDHMRRFGTKEEHFARVAVRNRTHAIDNPHAHLRKALSIEAALSERILSWPVRLSDCCPSSDGACAVILAADSAGRSRIAPIARIVGVGDASDGYFLGERAILSRREHIELAAKKAYQAAGIKAPLEAFDVAELQNPFTISELMSIEALGFADLGESGDFIDAGHGHFGSSIVINPSGGSLCSNPVGATSLVRLAEASLQVTGRAGDRQVPGAQRAIALASGGMIQFCKIMIVESSV